MPNSLAAQPQALSPHLPRTRAAASGIRITPCTNFRFRVLGSSAVFNSQGGVPSTRTYRLWSKHHRVLPGQAGTWIGVNPVKPGLQAAAASEALSIFGTMPRHAHPPPPPRSYTKAKCIFDGPHSCYIPNQITTRRQTDLYNTCQRARHTSGLVLPVHITRTRSSISVPRHYTNYSVPQGPNWLQLCC